MAISLQQTLLESARFMRMFTENHANVYIFRVSELSIVTNRKTFKITGRQYET